MSPLHHDHSADTAITAMASLPDAPAGTTVGPARGYRPNATLPVRVEFARQLRRRRTQLSLAFMVALPLILAGAFALGGDSGDGSTASIIDLAQSSAANFAIVTLFFSASFLLIVVISLFFGDTIASEASWSSLKYLLALPIPRWRLLRQKLVVAAILSAGCLAVLVGVAVLVGLILYGGGALTTPSGEIFRGWDAALRVLIATGSIALQLAWVAGLALLMTVCTDVPLGAVGTAVMLSIVSRILDQITALGDLRDFLPTHFSFAWTGAMVDPIQWGDMTRGAFSSVVYASVFTVAAFLRFRRKDITS